MCCIHCYLFPEAEAPGEIFGSRAPKQKKHCYTPFEFLAKNCYSLLCSGFHIDELARERQLLATTHAGGNPEAEDCYTPFEFQDQKRYNKALEIPRAELCATSTVISSLKQKHLVKFLGPEHQTKKNTATPPLSS